MGLLIDYLFPPVCAGCGRVGSYLCSDCHHHLPLNSPRPLSRFESVLPVYPYQFAIRNYLHLIKFEYVTASIPYLAKLISHDLIRYFPNLVNYWQESHFVIIPVPLHHFRQNYRGFNQSALIAKHLSQNLNLSFDGHLLVKTVNTIPQSHLSRSRRHLQSALYQIDSPLTPTNIIIFDDILTTGATLSSVASTFPDTTNLWGLTVAG